MRNVRVQVLGATTLTRAAVPYLLERRGARVVGIDPGEEHEGLPWFAPVRGLARDNGIPLGRAEADLVLDLDPDARPTAPEGVGLRVLAPQGARSPDLNRALLDPRAGGATGTWEVVLTDGRAAWGSRPVEVLPGDDAVHLMDRAALRALETLDAAWEALVGDGGAAPAPLARPLVGGRFRAQETFVNWELPAEAIVARVRACAGPWGGARTHLGETAIWLLDAEVHAPHAPAGWSPGTLLEVDDAICVVAGRGVVRTHRLRAGLRPPQSAGAFATASGVGPGYLLA